MRPEKNSHILGPGLRIFRKAYRDAGGHHRRSATWTIAIRFRAGEVRLPGSTDRRASEELCRAVGRIAAARLARQPLDEASARWVDAMPVDVRDRLVAAGVLDDQAAQAAVPLGVMLEDYSASLLAKGRTGKHVATTVHRCRVALVGCGFWTDVTARRVEANLVERRRVEGMKATTFNYHITAVRMFASWCIRTGRLASSPLATLGKSRVTDTTERRGLSVEEARELLAYLRGAGDAQADARAMLYEVAMTTGLRAAELASLTVAAFDLEGDPATVSLAAANAKNRRGAVLPLPAETAARLREHIARKLPSAPALPIRDPGHTAEHIRSDLAAARAAWTTRAPDATDRQRREESDFLRDVDGAGRVVVFHSLRHTRGAWLFRHHGVTPREALDAMRVGSFGLVERYSAGMRLDVSRLADTAPTLSSPDRAAAERMTGTAHARPFADARAGHRHGHRLGGLTRTSADAGGRTRPAAGERVTPCFAEGSTVDTGVPNPRGLLAELADAEDSKSSARKGVSVRLR